eukprot:tig00000204_g17773.t1
MTRLDLGLKTLAYPTLAASAALFVYQTQAVAVGGARQKFGVKAPATSGNADFERVFRAHQNTMEQLPILLPSLFSASVFVTPEFAGVLGLIWALARLDYGIQYAADAKKRGRGFIAAFLAQNALLIGGAVGAAIRIKKALDK